MASFARRLPGNKDGWGATRATAAGLVSFGEEGGALMAGDATAGKPRWSLRTNQGWKASPITYLFEGKQYVAVPAGADLRTIRLQ